MIRVAIIDEQTCASCLALHGATVEEPLDLAGACDHDQGKNPCRCVAVKDEDQICIE